MIFARIFAQLDQQGLRGFLFGSAFGGASTSHGRVAFDHCLDGELGIVGRPLAAGFGVAGQIDAAPLVPFLQVGFGYPLLLYLLLELCS